MGAIRDLSEDTNLYSHESSILALLPNKMVNQLKQKEET